MAHFFLGTAGDDDNGDGDDDVDYEDAVLVVMALLVGCQPTSQPASHLSLTDIRP